jgi:hypothetical protein
MKKCLFSLIEIELGNCVSNLNHGGVYAGSQTLDLREGEHFVLGGLADPDAQGLLAGRNDLVRAPQPARCGRANLDK